MIVSVVSRGLFVLLMTLAASCSQAIPRIQEPAVNDAYVPPKLTHLLPLPASEQADRQRQLRADVEAVLAAGFSVRAQHGFVYDANARAGGLIRNAVQNQIETEQGGIWLEVEPGVNERIATRVWRLPGKPARYLAYAWFTKPGEDERHSVVGLFELEKKAGAGEDRSHPRTGLWGGGAL